MSEFIVNHSTKTIIQNSKILELEKELAKCKFLVSRSLEFLKDSEYSHFLCYKCMLPLQYPGLVCRGCHFNICFDCYPETVNKCTNCNNTVMHIECEAKKDKICTECSTNFITIDECKKYKQGIHRKQGNRYDMYDCGHCSHCCNCHLPQLM